MAVRGAAKWTRYRKYAQPSLIWINC